jgi:signal peptidase II
MAGIGVSDRPVQTRREAMLWGPLTALGLAFAAIGCIVDQAQKAWALFPFDIATRQPVALTPFLDMVLVWNRGVSYGLFQQETETGQWILVAFKAVAVVLLTVWLARTHTRIGAIAIGLIIGGAVGNAVDRVLYGAVADFFHFHVGDFSWYVFNLADVWIVAGVALLLYEALLGKGRSGDAV